MTLLSVRGRWLAAWWIGVAMCFASAWGQRASSAALPASAQAVLTEMAGRAAIIFTGEVTAITRADASGYVDVKFRVDQPVKGVQKNGAYVLREWAGLWTGGVERYRVGQKFLMLLAARGSSGMSAPIGGMDGAIPLVAAGDSPLFHGNGDAPADQATDAPEPQVDLRWLAARAARTAVAASSEGRTMVVKTAAVMGRTAGKLNGVLDGEEGSGASSGASSGAILGPTEGGGAIASPILGGGDDESGAGWAGPVAPLPSVGTGQVPVGTYPEATKLSSILMLLASGSGSTAHVSR